jgi:hypothetical protein
MSSIINVQGCDSFGVSVRFRVNRLAIWTTMLLLSISMCFFISGCKDVQTIWSTETRSPDGQWIAIASTDQYSGPGNAGIYTTVSLKRTMGPKSPIQILAFTQNSKSIGLKMNWMDPKHLGVTYDHEAILDFQAIKCAGIDISVRDVSGEAAKPTQ